MEPEEESATKIKKLSNEIWATFELLPGKECYYDLKEMNEAAFIPDKTIQIGIIKKIEKWGGISNLKQNKNRLTFDVHKEEFKKFRNMFKNPKASFQSYKTNSIMPVPLPIGTTWEHIIIKFLNGNDVRIKTRNDLSFSHDATYNEMGFRDSKQNRPNKQWELLLRLAQFKKITWDNVQKLEDNEAFLLKKRKQLLSNTLKNYFQVEGEPFYDYRKEQEYRTKITLLPISASNKGLEDELQDYYSEQTPSV